MDSHTANADMARARATRQCRLALCLVLCFLLSMALVPATLQAAAGQTTILSGKVVSPVTRMPPLPFNAIVDEVLVAPGQAVIAGQSLLRYHLQEEAERILQKEVTLGAGTEADRAQVLTLERQLAEANAQRNKARQLVASKLGSPQALERLEGDVNSVQQRIKLLRSTIAKMESNFKERLQELAGYFGTPLKEGDNLPHNLILTSPIAGHVLSVASDMHPGTMLAAGATPIAVGVMNPMIIQVQVYEAEIGRIKEGDVATVNIPSLQDKAFAAKVTKIAWAASDLNVANPSFYTVELTIPNPELELKPGFKAVVHFGKAPQK